MKLLTLTTILPLIHALPNPKPNTAFTSILGPSSVPFLPTDFFLPGESSTREYLPTATRTTTEEQAVVTYAPPPPPGNGQGPGEGNDEEKPPGYVEAETTTMELETYTGAHGWGDPRSQLGWPFREGVQTRAWGNE